MSRHRDGSWWLGFAERHQLVIVWAGAALILLYTLIIEVGIITREPVLYWNDPYVRLAYRDQIAVGPWLPLVQTIIFVVTRITSDLNVLRVVLSVIAAGAAMAVYWFAGQQFGRAAGFLAAALIASNRMFVALSTVPYTEVVFIGLITGGLYFHDRKTAARDRWLAAVCFNLACLTRYEGWLLVAVLAAETFITATREDSGGWRAGLKDAAKLGIFYAGLPILWAATGGVTAYINEASGYAQNGSQVVWQSVIDFITMLRWQAGDAVLIAGGVGLVIALRRSEHRVMALRFIALIVLSFPWIVLINPGNLRQPFITLMVVLLYAGFAVSKLVEWAGRLITSRFGDVTSTPVLKGVLMAALGIVVLAVVTPESLAFVHNAANERQLVTDYQVGLWINAHTKPGDRVVVLEPGRGDLYMLSVYSGVPIGEFVDADEALTSHSAAKGGCTIVASTEGETSRAVKLVYFLSVPTANDTAVTRTNLEDAVVWTVCY